MPMHMCAHYVNNPNRSHQDAMTQSQFSEYTVTVVSSKLPSSNDGCKLQYDTANVTCTKTKLLFSMSFREIPLKRQRDKNFYVIPGTKSTGALYSHVMELLAAACNNRLLVVSKKHDGLMKCSAVASLPSHHDGHYDCHLCCIHCSMSMGRE